jgi:hypothetical protein
MQDKTKDHFLDILIGEKLSSVTFVMDYLQVDFDGNRFTFNAWPVVVIANVEYQFGDLSYRDKLCFLITKVVKKADFIPNEEVSILFDNNDRLFLLLNSYNPDLMPEIAIFKGISGELYVFQ